MGDVLGIVLRRLGLGLITLLIISVLIFGAVELLPGDIARYRQRNPGATPEGVIEDYLSYLPAASTRDACVYQTARGCSLPREMRQDICNAYYCDALRWLKQTWKW